METTVREKWENFRPTKTQALWFGVGCAAATLILGFGASGWVTGGTHAKALSDASATARHELAAEVCVQHFMAANDVKSRLASLHEASWWERSELLAKSGYATMPDRDEPNSVVAAMCASKLSEKTI